MTSNLQNVLAIGLPSTGKTTFLAAFWDVVGSGEVVDSLQLDKLTGDRHYLNEIRDKWADFHELPRTFLKDEGVFSMRLRDSKTGSQHVLNFADMSGESSERQWTERICAHRYLRQMSEATGIILFIHPQKIQRVTLIRDAERLLRRLPKAIQVAREGEGAVVPSPVTAAPIPTLPNYAATQVQLVDLLQVIELQSEQQPPFRVCIVVSAYDKIMKTAGNTPAKWVQKSLPLLFQYLTANPELFKSEFFGVSAQGGDLENAEQLRRQNIQASDRILVVRNGKSSHDITEPARWIFGLID